MSQVRLFEDDTILYRKIQSQSETNIFQENVDHLEGESRLSSSAPSVAEFSERLRRRPRTRCGVDERLQLGIPRPYHHSYSNETSAFAYRNLWGSPSQSKQSATRALHAQSWSTPPLWGTPARNTCRTKWRWSREKVQPYLQCLCPAGRTNSDSPPWNSVVLRPRSPRCTCL